MVTAFASRFSPELQGRELSCVPVARRDGSPLIETYTLD